MSRLDETNGRIALAETLAAELDMDLTPNFLRATDRVLARLWLHGYAVLPVPDEKDDALG